MLDKSGEVFSTCEREFIDLIDFEPFKIQGTKDDVKTDNFTFELLKNLP